MPEIATALPSSETSNSPMLSTHVRWRILALLMAYTALCHFNRVSISVAGTEHIMKDYSIDEVQMGIVYSAYLFIYTLCMIPGGWLLDHFGPRKALMFVGFGSAILVPVTGLSYFATAGSMLLVLCVIRGLLGVISAPIHPSAAKAVSFWMPPREQGVANGLVTGAAVAGVASTYFVFGSLMDLVGWPCAFLVAGAVTLLLSLVWTNYATDRPRQHSLVNTLEICSIEGTTAIEAIDRESAPRSADLTNAPTASKNQVGLLSLLCNRSLILLTISYATASYFQYLFFYWMQYYFNDVLKLGTIDSRFYATLPTVAMAIGMMCGGWLADRAQSRLGGRRGHAIVPVLGMIASALLLGMGIIVSHPFWVVTCFTLALGALGTSESSFWVTGVTLGGRRGGLSSSILNAGGNVGGIIAPMLTPLFSQRFGWQAGIALASVLCIVGAVLWRWIDPGVETPSNPYFDSESLSGGSSILA